MYSRGISQSDIGRIIGLSRNTINLVVMNDMVNQTEIDLCIEWLSMQKKTQHVNKRYTSYYLKHVVENWCGTYISNDSFIGAVHLLDWDYEIAGESGRNIYVPISNKTVKLYLNKEDFVKRT